jgi:hypothetical protein
MIMAEGQNGGVLSGGCNQAKKGKRVCPIAGPIIAHRPALQRPFVKLAVLEVREKREIAKYWQLHQSSGLDIESLDSDNDSLWKVRTYPA